MSLSYEDVNRDRPIIAFVEQVGCVVQGLLRSNIPMLEKTGMSQAVVLGF